MFSSYQKTTLLNIVANPFFLAIPITLIIVIFLPNPTSKYKIELKSKHVADKPNSKIKFCDLDGDGVDERIISYHNAVKGEASIKVLTTEGINYDAWNFHGYFQKSSKDFYCGDLNKDGFSEIYVLYYKSDSVFLGIIQPYPKKKLITQRKFLTVVKKRNGKIDYTVNSFAEADFNKDGINELIFSLNAGYSRQPRIIIKYNLQNDSITKSESTGIYMSNFIITDLDGDSVPEIYSGSSTTGNIPDNIGIKYGDYNSWYLGFDNNLNYLFDPIKNIGYPSRASVCSFKSDNEQNYVVVLFDEDNYKDATIKFFNNPDKAFSSKKFSNTNSPQSKVFLLMQNITLDGKKYVLMGIEDDEFIVINENLEVIRKKALREFTSLKFISDLNRDNKNEFVFVNRENVIAIYDDKLSNPTTFASGIIPFSTTWVETGIKHNGNKQTELFLKTDNYLYLYTYKIDYLYYLKYPIWFFIYGFVILILWFAQRMQKMQTKRKLEVEETINSLQMKTIKSQMDPHFIYNVLNGMAHNVAMGNTKDSYDQIIKFSLILRLMMKRVDKIDISIKEELVFIRNYLELEKYRFKEGFEFKIKTDPKVDLTYRIPRMIIQLLVENSIKHGLWDKKGVKILDISTVSRNKKILIVVEDNGIGRTKAKEKDKDTTGKGTSLINDMIELNYKLSGNKITLIYVDLYDDTGNASGTRAEVEL